MPAPSTTALKNALDKGYNLDAKQRVLAEWNMNRYAALIVADNAGIPEATNNPFPGIFPIMSIVQPIRPTTGLATARVDVSQIFDNKSDNPDLTREYVADETNKYKHWASPVKSQAAAVSGSYPIASAAPYVMYGKVVGGANVYQSVKANKIVVTFELSQAKPVLWDVYLRTSVSGANGAALTYQVDPTPIISNAAIDAKGQTILYFQANGTWSTSPGNYLTAPGCDLSAIEIGVNSMNKAGQYLNLIEVSPRLERDISDRVIDFSTNYELSQDDQISPVGTISANTASISLSNAIDNAVWPNPGYFETSPLYGPLDANVLFKIDFGVDTTNYSGSGYEWTRLATMYSESWPISEDTISISLKDSSKFLQEIKPNAMLFQDLSIGEVIWRILDSVGMNNWKYNVSIAAANMRIAYFWTNPDTTVWQQIQDLCRSTQSVAYIDEDGVFQIKTRDNTFTVPTDTNLIPKFRSDNEGVLLSNIENATFGDQFQVNSVTINYRPTNLAVDALGRPISEIVWQPEENSVVLRCSNLKTDMNATQKTFWMDQKDAVLWPFAGLVNIQGEVIRYVGKHYYYIDNTGKWAGLAVFSAEQQQALDNDPTRADVGQNWRNYYSGLFYITERGVGATYPTPHEAYLTGWYLNGGWVGLAGGTQRKWTGGMKYFQADGFLRLETNKTFTNGHIYTAPRGTPGYTKADMVYGTRMRFPTSPTGGAFNCGGVFFYGNAANTDMYMVDVATTSTIETGKFRARSNEIRILKRSGGTLTQLNKGAVFGVARGQWVDLDVKIDSNYAISVSINGTVVLTATDPSARIPVSNKCGVHVRGFTACDFEYFYAVPGGLLLDGLPDGTDFLSQLRGGYESRQLTHWVIGWFAPAWGKGFREGFGYWLKDAYKDRYIEEFGAPIHEIREYSVLFNKTPVLYSSLYVSNVDQIVTNDYVGNPFGASFTIANSSRINSVVHGEDTVTYGANNSVQQQMVVTARTIQQQDPQQYIVKDDVAINTRGEITLEISSDWIQSKEAAKAIGDWIVNHWANPADTMELVTFGNPLVRVGDIISVNYAAKQLTDVKFVVLKCDQSWDTGLQTTLTCRKCP